MTVATFPAEVIEVYRATARQREVARREQLGRQRQRAWIAARQAAALLRQRFGAKRVAVFGSLVDPDLFHERSDIDLAVWGMGEADFLRAVAELLRMVEEIEVDLIRWESASATLRERIQQEGVDV